MCAWINDTLQGAFDDGSWADAFEKHPRPVRCGDAGAAGAGLLQLIDSPVRGGVPRRTPPRSRTVATEGTCVR